MRAVHCRSHGGRVRRIQLAFRAESVLVDVETNKALERYLFLGYGVEHSLRELGLGGYHNRSGRGIGFSVDCRGCGDFDDFIAGHFSGGEHAVAVNAGIVVALGHAPFYPVRLFAVDGRGELHALTALDVVGRADCDCMLWRGVYRIDRSFLCCELGFGGVGVFITVGGGVDCNHAVDGGVGERELRFGRRVFLVAYRHDVARRVLDRFPSDNAGFRNLKLLGSRELLLLIAAGNGKRESEHRHE